jgi:Amt family ammonium transporter
MLKQTIIQCTAAVATAAYTAVASYGCLMLVKRITGGSLRVPEEQEDGEGLDMWCHGESCYSLSEGEILER